MFTRSQDDNIVTSLHLFTKSVRPERITRATSHPVELCEMFVVAGLGASQRWNHVMYKRHQIEQFYPFVEAKGYARFGRSHIARL